MWQRCASIIAISILISTSALSQEQLNQAPAESPDQSNAQSSPAQTPPLQETDQIVKPIETAHTPSTLRKIFTNFAHDQKGIWMSPFRINRENGKWWALFGGGTLAFIAMDEGLSNALPDSPNRVKFSKQVSQIGATYIALPVSGGLYLFGRITDNPKAREAGVLGAETMLDSYLVVSMLKLAAGRERPEVEGGEGRFFKGNHGFPSGHAIITWSFASLISHEYAPSKVVPIVAYGTATIVSLSRFTARKHFASDILAGGALGWFIGRYVFLEHLDPAIHKRFNPTLARYMPTLIPIFETRSHSYGVSLMWNP
jgi:membrane-associated phospholipid phosphatase